MTEARGDTGLERVQGCVWSCWGKGICYAVLCCAMLFCAVLCYIMLCCAVLHYAMVCYAMLCCAVLCYAAALDRGWVAVDVGKAYWKVMRSQQKQEEEASLTMDH